MLEKDFSELDNDFITVWSSCILNSAVFGHKVFNKDREVIEKLAELGQIDAQIVYYSFLKKNEQRNIIIDNMVSGYNDKNPMELWAKLYKTCFEEDFFKIAKLIFNQPYMLFDGYPEIVKNSIEDFKSFRLLCQTKQALLEKYLKTNNPMDLEKYFSIVTQFPVPETMQENKFLDKNASKLQKSLIQAYKQNPNSPKIALSLGNHFIFMDSYYLIPHEKQGQKILSTLSNRPYSKTLQDYQLKGKSTPAVNKDKAE